MKRNFLAALGNPAKTAGSRLPTAPTAAVLKKILCCPPRRGGHYDWCKNGGQSSPSGMQRRYFSAADFACCGFQRSTGLRAAVTSSRRETRVECGASSTS